MKDRPENLFLQIGNTVHSDDRRANKSTILRCIEVFEKATVGLCHSDMRVDLAFGGFIDHRPAISREVARVANQQLIHRAVEHLQERHRRHLPCR